MAGALPAKHAVGTALSPETPAKRSRFSDPFEFDADSEPVLLSPTGRPLVASAGRQERFQPREVVWYPEDNGVLMWPASVEAWDDARQVYILRPFGETHSVEVPFSDSVKKYHCDETEKYWAALKDDAQNEDAFRLLQALVERAAVPADALTKEVVPEPAAGTLTARPNATEASAPTPTGDARQTTLLFEKALANVSNAPHVPTPEASFFSEMTTAALPLQTARRGRGGGRGAGRAPATTTPVREDEHEGERDVKDGDEDEKGIGRQRGHGRGRQSGRGRKGGGKATGRGSGKTGGVGRGARRGRGRGAIAVAAQPEAVNLTSSSDDDDDVENGDEGGFGNGTFVASPVLAQHQPGDAHDWRATEDSSGHQKYGASTKTPLPLPVLQQPEITLPAQPAPVAISSPAASAGEPASGREPASNSETTGKAAGMSEDALPPISSGAPAQPLAGLASASPSSLPPTAAVTTALVQELHPATVSVKKPASRCAQEPVQVPDQEPGQRPVQGPSPAFGVFQAPGPSAATFTAARPVPISSAVPVAAASAHADARTCASLVLADPVPIFDVDARLEFDQKLAARVDRLNAIVRLRRDLAQSMRAAAPALGGTLLQALPAPVPAQVGYTLANFVAGLFALKPWEGPTSEQERFDALTAAIDAEVRVHTDEVLRLGRDTLRTLVTPHSMEA